MELDKPITIAIILFVILVLIFYMVLPKYQEFQKVLTEVGRKEAEFQSKDAYYVEITRVYKELMLYQDSLKRIENALPENFSSALIINFLQKRGVENGVILKRVSVGKGTTVGKGTGVKEASLFMQIVGNYESFKNFIRSIERSSRLIEGENVSFSVAPPTVENPNPSQIHTFNLEIKAYSY